MEQKVGKKDIAAFSSFFPLSPLPSTPQETVREELGQNKKGEMKMNA